VISPAQVAPGQRHVQPREETGDPIVGTKSPTRKMTSAVADVVTSDDVTAAAGGRRNSGQVIFLPRDATHKRW